MDKNQLINNVRSKFSNEFSSTNQLMTLTPARLNIIGEHTDYTGGYVLPCLLPSPP